MQEAAMYNIVHLWNPRSSRNLPRHWLPFGQRIVFPGPASTATPTAVLSIVPAGEKLLHARLECGATVDTQDLTPGEEIQLQLPSALLTIDIKAIDSTRMLVEMTSPSGGHVKVSRNEADASVLLSA
jgi:hypothetical protein